MKPSVAQTALFTIKWGFVIFMRAPVLLTLFGVSWTLLFFGKALQRAFDFCHNHLPVAVRPRLHQCGDEDATATLEAQLAITPSSSAHSPNTPTPPAEPDKTTDSVGVGSGDLFGVDGATGRGFPYVEFHDEYGQKCSIQISSRVVFENEDGTADDPLGWIWLGIDDAKPQIMKSKAKALGMEMPPGEVSGWMPYPIPADVLLTTRMHLNEKQVRGLIARLTMWLETGDLSPNAVLSGNGEREKRHD